MRLPALMAIAHKAGLSEDAEMFRNGRLRDAGLRRERANCLLALAAKPFEDSPPGRVGERSEQKIVRFRHRQSITR
jgi:hypothetical protein